MIDLLRETASRFPCVVVVMSVLAALAPAGAEESPMLVEYLPEVMAPADEVAGAGKSKLDDLRADPGVIALRVGRASPGPVVHARALSIPLPGSGEVLSVSDLVVEDLASGHALYTRDRQATTSITLVVIGEDVVGTLYHDGAVYGIGPLGGGLTAVYLYDATQLRAPPEDTEDFLVPDVDPEGAALVPQPSGPTAAQDRGDQIDVLAAYTANVRRSAVNVGARIELLVLNTNLRYRNSGITTRLRLVHSYETSYAAAGERDSDGKRTDLVRLRTPGDGWLDDVHERRDRSAADVVLLLYQTPENRCGGGRAYMLNHHDGFDKAGWAFAVSGVGRREACNEIDSQTFAHEIGHVQGAAHNPEQERLDNADPSPYPYGHGFCNAARGWRTVMAYNTGDRCSDRIPYFSNPAVNYRGAATGDTELRNVARLINETAFSVANFRRATTRQPDSYSIPLVTPASNRARQGFVRIVNRSPRAGTVRIHAIDDRGRRFGPASLSLEARQTKHFTSTDLERGSSSKGLTGVGDGAGNWRLELETELDIEPLAYIRTVDGFVTSMHEVAAETEEGSMRYRVPFFNPGSNREKVSMLRLINPGDRAAAIVITGVDDQGNAPPRGEVRLSLGAGAARMLTAQQIEEGGSDFSGRFGDGSGKWQLSVSADRPIQVMSLLQSPTGHLANLSRGTASPPAGTPPPPPGDQPDLVVRSPSVSDGTPDAGASFTFRATVHNRGDGRSAATTLRYYRSSDAAISTTDSEVGTDLVSGLSASGASGGSIGLRAPATAGTYFYGACVDSVPGESDTANNCSGAVRITVQPSNSDNTSTSWEITDRCNDRRRFEFRFFGYDNGGVRRATWPSRDRIYYTPGYNRTVASNLACTGGITKVCIGGRVDGNDRRYWGVDIDGSEGCTNCCERCSANPRTRTYRPGCPGSGADEQAGGTSNTSRPRAR